MGAGELADRLRVPMASAWRMEDREHKGWPFRLVTGALQKLDVLDGLRAVRWLGAALPVPVVLLPLHGLWAPGLGEAQKQE